MLTMRKLICWPLKKIEESISKRSSTSQEVSNLKAGDVIFARANTAVSIGIQFVTWSRWSHVALYLGDGWVIDTDMLRRVSIHRIDDFPYWTVKRYLHMKDWHLRSIVSYMVERLGADYDYKQILGFLFEQLTGIKNTWNDKDKYTCGKLFDLAFLSAGIDLVDDQGDGDVMPRDLFNSLLLHDI